ncbi:GNAT family N-acetyltransferase [Caviibacterium pharyngocola]|uniref:N-acetyltransferase n=1 Tax=Caviibacterium pharyngocola TaxID=28159 RepID=A0A2M8RWR6_9PAST|nr:GNAT family N-acetyltransferase [Caviibacterium pharyngocola]PJG83335.1 N-acetyltransferase [Caviibacterium pharyngocola]
MNWREEPLNKGHNRTSFDCGNDDLNHFLRHYARQSHSKNTSKTYVAIDDQTDGIIGFYTITLGSVSPKSAPIEFSRRFGGHSLPLFTLARLAVDKKYQGKGLGGQLLLKAAKRCFAVSAQVGGIGLFIEAKNQDGANWYRLFGGVPLIDEPCALILPFSSLNAVLK